LSAVVSVLVSIRRLQMDNGGRQSVGQSVRRRSWPASLPLSTLPIPPPLPCPFSYSTRLLAHSSLLSAPSTPRWLSLTLPEICSWPMADGECALPSQPPSASATSRLFISSRMHIQQFITQHFHTHFVKLSHFSVSVRSYAENLRKTKGRQLCAHLGSFVLN